MPEPDRVVAAYRAQTAQIADRTTLDLLDAWPVIDPTRLDATFDAWLLAADAAYLTRSVQAQQAGRDFYEALRIASDVTVPLAPRASAPLDVSTFVTDMKIKVLIGVKTAMTSGRGVDNAMRAAFVTSTGRAVKHVLDAGRSEVLALGQSDPASSRWERVTAGGCEFCRALAAKGAVYYGDSADFAAHDHCRCIAVPRFGGTAKQARAYAGPTRQRSDADRARLREHLQATRA